MITPWNSLSVYYMQVQINDTSAMPLSHITTARNAGVNSPTPNS